MSTLKLFLTTHFEQIIEEWQVKLNESWNNSSASLLNQNLERHCQSLLKGFIGSVVENQAHTARNELAELLTEVGTIWAKRGLSASETSKFIITLKQTLIQRVREAHSELNEALFNMILDLEGRLDELMLICHQAYTNSREKMIKQQNAALLELSSPVVKMWDKILLVPLIGVIDTGRAKQITESLLTEISRLEATVAVMDLTGVPVFDTAVAGHLVKTINAAHMLGCKIVMTGISPEGALVLTKLGIEFKDVITRGNLHSGVRAAFSIQNLTVKSESSAA